MKKIDSLEYMVRPNKKVSLNKIDSSLAVYHGKEKDAKESLEKLRKKLIKLQNMLYAEHKHKVLVILQAMDTGGKDSTIRLVFRGVNPQGVKVACFKKPTDMELAHDYLWRIHRQAPASGEMVIFNRSHYEDVLIARVHKLVRPEVWRKRFFQINDFERVLSEEGTAILKFYLHISKDEQKKRLEERLNNPHKLWKFQEADLAERKLWPEYIRAYEEVFLRTSTKTAPWHIIPADDKLSRNLIIANILVNKLKDLKMKYPQPINNIKNIRVK